MVHADLIKTRIYSLSQIIPHGMQRLTRQVEQHVTGGRHLSLVCNCCLIIVPCFTAVSPVNMRVLPDRGCRSIIGAFRRSEISFGSLRNKVQGDMNLTDFKQLTNFGIEDPRTTTIGGLPSGTWTGSPR